MPKMYICFPGTWSKYTTYVFLRDFRIVVNLKIFQAEYKTHGHPDVQKGYF